MKAYSIGRESGCDIVINDSTDVISRRHAVLNVMPSGKMTIVDQSHNGTYVNGIRISPNVPVPITRKDNISFAHVARLDWNAVPKTINPVVYIVSGVVAVLVIVGGVLGYNYFSNKSAESQQTPTAVVDTTKTQPVAPAAAPEAQPKPDDAAAPDGTKSDDAAAQPKTDTSKAKPAPAKSTKKAAAKPAAKTDAADKTDAKPENSNTKTDNPTTETKADVKATDQATRGDR